MYVKTQWVDNTTPIDSTNLNKIEQGIYDNSLVADAVNNVVKPNDETYKDVEITEGQITDVLAVNDVLVKGDTLQDGEPTPDSPVDIHVVSGSNVISTSNKNLLDVSAITTQTLANVTITNNGDGSLTLNGTSNSTGALKDFLIEIPLKRNITYTFSKGIFVSGSYYVLSLRDSSSTVIANSSLDSGVKYVNFTPQSDVLAKYLRLYIAPNKTFTNYTIRPMLEISSSTTLYEPHQGKELPLDLPIENLLNPTAPSQTLQSGGTMTKNSDNTYTLTGGSSNYADLIVIGTIDVVEGKTYYLFDNVIGNSNNNLSIRRGSTMLVSTNEVKSIGYTATATETLNIYIRYQDTSIRIYSPMVSTQIVSVYTPYGTVPIELCKIGDYQDYFYRDNGKWYLHKEIKKHIIDGNEVTEIAGNSFNEMYANGNIARAFTINDMRIASSRAETISNTFNVVSETALWNGVLVGIQCYLNANKIAISAPISNIESFLGEALTVNNYTNAYIQYLASIGTYFYYISPTDAEITDTTLISQLEAIYNAPLYEQTNITQTNNDLPIVLDITACKDNINGIKAWIRK